MLADPGKAAGYVEQAAGTVAQATGVDALAQGFTEAVQTPVRVLNWLTEPGTWVRIALFAVGGAMLVGGMLLFARPAIESTAQTAAKLVLPTGKVGKIVQGAGK
jgi:hypothetical protein